MNAGNARHAAHGAHILTLAAVPPGSLLFTSGIEGGILPALVLTLHFAAAAIAGCALGCMTRGKPLPTILRGLAAGALLATLDRALLTEVLPGAAGSLHLTALWLMWALSSVMAALLLQERFTHVNEIPASPREYHAPGR